MTIESNNAPLCYVGVGSNLGNKLENIKKALEFLKDNSKIEFYRMSPIYQAKAVDMDNAPDFYNCVFEIKTNETPESLLSICKDIERKMGRDISLVMKSRIIDLDILTYGNLTIKTPKLIIPHLRMHERLFVIAPLNDLSPELIHPVFKSRISELYEKLSRLNDVQRLTHSFEVLDPIKNYE